jgi:hypothetical protein
MILRGTLIQFESLSLHKKRWEEVAEKRKLTNAKRPQKQVKMASFIYVQDVKVHLDAKEAKKVEDIWQQTRTAWS